MGELIEDKYYFNSFVCIDPSLIDTPFPVIRTFSSSWPMKGTFLMGNVCF